jgi:hypothetical protein
MEIQNDGFAEDARSQPAHVVVGELRSVTWLGQLWQVRMQWYLVYFGRTRTIGVMLPQLLLDVITPPNQLADAQASIAQLGCLPLRQRGHFSNGKHNLVRTSRLEVRTQVQIVFIELRGAPIYAGTTEQAQIKRKVFWRPHQGDA